MSTRSDHVLIEFEVNHIINEGRREEHKNKEYNYDKADFVRFKLFFRRNRLE